MSALESGVDQFFPYVGQLMGAGAEHVDPLPAGELGVEAVLLRDLADHDQLFRRDLAAGNPRNDRIGAAALDVGQEAVVRVLQPGMIENVLVPEAGEDGSHGRFADLASMPSAVALHKLVERADLLDLDDLEKLLPGVGEMLAEVIIHLAAGRLQFGMQKLGHQREASAAAGAGLSGRLDLPHGVELSFANRAADLPFADVVAGADLDVVREIGGLDGRAPPEPPPRTRSLGATGSGPSLL